MFCVSLVVLSAISDCMLLFTVRLRRSRVKAQSIENLFDSLAYEHSVPIPNNEHASAFHPPRDYRLHSSADIRPDNNRNAYNASVNQHLATDHRKIAASTSALSLPVSMGPLRGERDMITPLCFTNIITSPTVSGSKTLSHCVYPTG